MPCEIETQRLAKRLKSQKLMIPALKPIFSHWPSMQNENYARMKIEVEQKLPFMLPSKKHQKAIYDADPALLAARWWPTSTWERYQVMTDLTMWFGIWDDVVERIEDHRDADEFREATKAFVAQSFGLAEPESMPMPTNPVICSFEGIAERIREAYDLEQRVELLRHFYQYIDATRIETEFEKSESVPSLERYWEVRTLTSGMGILLGMSEYALEVKLPMYIITSAAYESLWLTTIIINSVVNDLISLKKEMQAGSVISSVAILFHEFNDLDLAVQLSLNYLEQLVQLYDRTAEKLLQDVAPDPDTHESLGKVIDLFRMVNTGNLEWSLGAKRYNVTDYIQEDGSIELYL